VPSYLTGTTHHTYSCMYYSLSLSLSVCRDDLHQNDTGIGCLAARQTTDHWAAQATAMCVFN